MNLLRRHPVASFFILACLISWTIWLPLYLPHFGITHLPVLPFHHALGAFGPLLAAFSMAAVEDGREGAGMLLKRMVQVRAPLKWYVVALFLPFILLALALLLSHLIFGNELSFAGIGQTNEFPEFSMGMYLLYNIITFGYGEETGWRGYALPRLQLKHWPLTSSAMLTLGWALWHLPLFFYRPGYTEMGVGGAFGWLLSLLMGSFLLTWLFNGSRGSIFLCALFHATIDVAFVSDATNPEAMQYLGMLVTMTGILVVFRLNRQQPVLPFHEED